MSEFNPATGDKKVKKAKRIARARGLKNFGWWLFGFLSSFIVVAGVGALAVCVIPASTFFGKDSDKYISDDAGKETLLGLITNYQNYSVGDFPVVSDLLTTIIDSSGFDQYVTVDFDALNDISLGAFSGQGGQNIEEALMSAIHVTATISSLGLTSQLGDLAALSAMTSYDVVTADVNPDDEGFNPKLYYYKVDDTPTYARAFTDDNPAMLVPGATLPYYYPAMVDVPLLEMFDIFGERLSTTTVTSLLNIFGEVGDDSLVGKILSGKTLGELGALGPSDINLPDVLEIDGNESIYKILCSAAGVDFDELQAGTARLSADMLNGMNIDAIKLSDVLEKTSGNEKIFDLIVSAVVVGEGETRPTADDVTLGHLKSINADNIKLSDVLPITSDNESVYGILSNATGLDDEDITVGSLNNISLDNVKLTAILPDDAEHADAWDAILAFTGLTNKEDVTIDSLSSTDLNSAKLSSFLKEDEASESLMRLLVDGTGGDLASIDAISDSAQRLAALKEAYKTVTIGDLKTLDVDNIHLSSVLTLDDDDVLKKILIQGIPSAGGDFNAIRISDLSSLDIDGIKLATVMPEDTASAKLVALLSDATGSSYGSITISQLKSINISAAHVSSVIDLTSNDTMRNILVEGTGKNNIGQVTIGDLESLDISQVKLATVMNDPNTDQKLKTIILQASGKSSWGDVTVGDLASSSFNFNNVKISAVLGTSNQKLLDILCEACNTNIDGLTVGKVSSDFDVSRITIQTIMDSSQLGGNKILEALYAKNPTISNLGSEMNNVTLHEAFGEDCFTTDSSKSVRGDKYVKNSDGSFTLNQTNGTYYVNKDAGVWLLFCFDATTTDATNGRAATFSKSNKTIATLQSGTGTSDALMQSKIYQLIACGILDESGGQFDNKVTKLSLNEAIAAMSSLAPYLS